MYTCLVRVDLTAGASSVADSVAGVGADADVDAGAGAGAGAGAPAEAANVVVWRGDWPRVDGCPCCRLTTWCCGPPLSVSALRRRSQHVAFLTY